MKLRYDEIKQSIALELADALNFSKIAIGLDIWTDKIKNMNYLGVTTHYVRRNPETKRLELQSKVL